MRWFAAALLALTVSGPAVAQTPPPARADVVGATLTRPPMQRECKARGRVRAGRYHGIGTPILSTNADIQVDGSGQVLTNYCP